MRQGYDGGVLERMAGADTLVFVFPLYGYGLPGALMALLEDFTRYIRAGHPHKPDANVYVVVNCAYHRPELTTGEVVRVMRNFCRRMALQWRLAVCIGTGPVVVLTRKMPLVNLKLKHACADIAADIAGADQQPKDNCYIHPIIPEFIIRRIKESYEKKGGMIRKGDDWPNAD